MKLIILFFGKAFIMLSGHKLEIRGPKLTSKREHKRASKLLNSKNLILVNTF
jgi:hypothetical protein